MLQNIKIKIFSVALASIFWLFIISSTNQIKTLNYNLAIEPTGLAENLVILNKNALPKVKIYYKSNNSNLTIKNLTSDDFSVMIKLNDLTEGSYTLPIFASANYPEIEIISFIPQEVNIVVEQKQTREFIPELVTDGRAQIGYKITNAVTKTEKVFVTGPQSIIDQIDKIEAKTILLGTEATDQIKKAELKAVNSTNKVLGELEFDPPTINIELSIELDEETKTIGILPNLEKISLEEGFYIKNVQVIPPVVTIRGKTEIIKNIDNINTVQLPISNIKQNYSSEIDLAVPNEVYVVAPKDRKVILSLELASLNFQREATAFIKTKNLSSNLALKYENPILVTLTGTPEALDVLNENDISFTIDLKNQNSIGEKTIEVKKSDFVYPQNITLVDFYPKLWNIEIVKK